MRITIFIGLLFASPLLAGNYLGTDRADVEEGLRLYTEKQLADMKRRDRQDPPQQLPKEEIAEPEVAPKNWDDEITNLMQQETPKAPQEDLQTPKIPNYPESFTEMEMTPPKPPRNGDWQQLLGQELKPRDNKKPPGELITIPAGSFIMADLLTGVDAPSQNSIPALIRTRFGFVSPNHGFVDLSGCHVIAQATGDLSTERVKFKTLTLSCLSPEGIPEAQAFTAYAAGEDDSFGVAGELRSRQGRVALMAFLNGVVEGATKLVSETSSTVVSPISALGNEGSSSAAVEVVRWYLEHAKELVPTIEVKAGAPIRLVLLEPLSISKSFFKKYSPNKDLNHETIDLVL